MFNIIKLHLPLFYEWENEFEWQPRKRFIVKSSRCVFSSQFVVVFIVIIFTFIEFHPKERKCILCIICVHCSHCWVEPCIYILYLFQFWSIFLWNHTEFQWSLKIVFFYSFVRNRHLYDILPSYCHFFIIHSLAVFWMPKKCEATKKTTNKSVPNAHHIKRYCYLLCLFLVCKLELFKNKKKAEKDLDCYVRVFVTNMRNKY